MSTQPPNSDAPCIYLSGKITGLPVEATEAKFSEAARLLRAKGYRIINPLRLGIPPNASWESAMAVCLEALKGADILLPYRIGKTVRALFWKLKRQRHCILYRYVYLRY